MPLTKRNYIVIFALLVASSRTDTTAYPIGAGGCDGSGSVGSVHLTADSLATGHLIDYGLEVYMSPEDESFLEEDPEVQLTNGYEKNLLLGRPYHIRLAAASETKGFRGFLFRITSSVADTDGSFSIPESLSASEQGQQQIAQVCEDLGFGGMTHTNNTIKTQAEAILLLDMEGRDLFLEITAVIGNHQENGTTRSEYYWDSYTINVVTNSSALPSPTNPPVAKDGEESAAVSCKLVGFGYLLLMLFALLFC